MQQNGFLDFKPKEMEINRKLKSIYFVWSDNYFGPPPRSFETTFEENLYYNHYDFCDDSWLEKILKECDIPTKEEFDQQVTLIKEAYKVYNDQQVQKRERRSIKKFDKYCRECEKNGVLPF